MAALTTPSSSPSMFCGKRQGMASQSWSTSHSKMFMKFWVRLKWTCPIKLLQTPCLESQDPQCLSTLGSSVHHLDGAVLVNKYSFPIQSKSTCSICHQCLQILQLSVLHGITKCQHGQIMAAVWSPQTRPTVCADVTECPPTPSC